MSLCSCRQCGLHRKERRQLQDEAWRLLLLLATARLPACLRPAPFVAGFCRVTVRACSPACVRGAQRTATILCGCRSFLRAKVGTVRRGGNCTSSLCAACSADSSRAQCARFHCSLLGSLPSLGARAFVGTAALREAQRFEERGGRWVSPKRCNAGSQCLSRESGNS